RLAHLRKRAHELDRPVSPRSGERFGPPADARLPGARAGRVTRRNAGRLRVLAPDAPGMAYTPAFSPDGRTIAYSRWKPGGYRDIHLYDLASGTDRKSTRLNSSH